MKRGKSSYRIRGARIGDIDVLEPFIAAYTGDGTLLPRNRENLARHIRDFRVACDGDEIIGCGALQIVDEDLAEVRTIVVTPQWRGAGVGHKLLEALIADARRLSIARLACLTRQVGFFERHGFGVVPKERFPHKIWNDCRFCPRQFACDETAMERVLRKRAGRATDINVPDVSAQASSVLPIVS
jgi:amino-acid N-acetyltransferase